VPEGVGLLDTSVVLSLGQVLTSELPEQGAIAALTLAELAAGPIATTAPDLRVERQTRLQTAEAAFDVLSFDAMCARAWPRVYSATVSVGRKPRGARAVDLMIATTALANGLALYTTNHEDFSHLSDLIEVRSVTPVSGTA
jgi:predicted nucleic acid-binding protein